MLNRVSKYIKLLKSAAICIIHGVNPFGNPAKLYEHRNRFSENEKKTIIDGCMSERGRAFMEIFLKS